MAALQELVRLLRPGGRALVYVWAMEQEYNQKKSKYLRENRVSPRKGEEIRRGTSGPGRASGLAALSDFQQGERSSRGATKSQLPVHTNRTSFRSQDLLVPWHLQGQPGKDQPAEPGGAGAPHGPSPVFHRFYHVFREGELEGACRALGDVRVLRSYYDQGNWCVILEKA